MKTEKLTHAEAKEALWHRGRLSWKLHAGQKIIDQKFKEVSRQLFVANISRQWGKSYWAVTKAISQALESKGSKIKYGTAFQTDLLEFILPAFEKVLEDCPPSLRPTYKSQRSRYEFPNGSQIKLVGLDKSPNSLRGNVIDLIIIDEAGFVTNLDYLYSSVIIPATTHRPNCKIIMISTPPSTPAHPFGDFVQKAEIEGGYACLNIYSNPLIDETRIQTLMEESGGAHTTTWRREYLCEIVTDGDLAIVPEWDSTYVEERARDVYHQFYWKYVSMDLGVKDQTAVLYGYYDFLKAQLVIEDEFVMSGTQMTTFKLAAALKAKEKELWGDSPVYLRVSDNNNPLLLQDLSYEHQIHFVPTDKGTLEEMVNKVKVMANLGQIIVHPRCKQLSGSLKYGVWDKNRRHFARSKTYGHFDALAALIYLVRNLNKASNPIPQTFQVDQGNALIFPQPILSQDAQTLRNAFGFTNKGRSREYKKL